MKNERDNRGVVVKDKLQEKYLQNILGEAKTLMDERVLKTILSFLLLSPRQQITFKLVCKNWKKVLDSIPYFLGINNKELPYDVALKKVAMAIAPVNSSGDIYHMLMAVILSCHEGNKIAPIYLAEDEVQEDTKDVNTRDQVVRALNFVDRLGYQGCFFQLHTARNLSPQSVSRQKQLITKLKGIGVTFYLDNRLSTSLIALYVKKYGLQRTTSILRENLAQSLTYLSKKERQSISKFLKDEYQPLRDKLLNLEKPVVIIHYRKSTKANKEQKFDNIAGDMVKFLTANYSVVIVSAGGTTSLSDFVIAPFDYHDNTCNTDLAKIYHLALLLKLYEDREKLQIKGVIGNTSGTLDLAAFIGHKVFDVHTFSKGVDYQSWRLLLQHGFMVIDNANNKLIVDKLSNVLFYHLQNWLNDNKQPPKEELGLIKKGSGTKGFNRSAFKLVSNIYNLDDDSTKAIDEIKKVEKAASEKFGNLKLS
jgi:hypothetical protein